MTITYSRSSFCNIFYNWESFSRAARKAFAGRMLCRPGVKEWYEQGIYQTAGAATSKTFWERRNLVWIS